MLILILVILIIFKQGRETCCQAFGARLVQTLKDLFCCNQKTQHKKMMSDASEPSVVDYEVSL